MDSNRNSLVPDTSKRPDPFQFRYDYQRADLKVDGPSFYGKIDNAATYEAIYMASGMAAISALLLASAQVTKQAELLVMQGSYPETLELSKDMRHICV